MNLIAEHIGASKLKTPPRMDDLAGMKFRYIKFGPNGTWAAKAIEEDALFLGHKEVPHELASSLDRNRIAAHLEASGKTKGKASDFTREILDFYSLGPDTIWITFHNGRLYWTVADGNVTWLGENGLYGARKRQALFPWLDTDLEGRVLVQDQLSSLLTRVAAYRQTICSIADPDYLRRRLAGQGDPDVAAADNALKLLSENAATLIGKLHQDDFETLVGILLERQGYHRVSRIGGTLKDVDMAVEHSFTGERLFVQAKSKASQSVLNDYIQRFETGPGFARMVFAVHSPIGQLSAGNRPDIDIWDRRKLAGVAVRAGLVEWLMARAT